MAYPKLKRSTDLIVAVVALSALFPLLVLAMAIIRFESNGPALFRSERVGLSGKTFLMLKLRTMADGAHLEYHRLRKERPHALNGPLYKDTNDSRVTRFGRLLRKISMDEAPQLWNVIKGDMSLVGPRPLHAVELSALGEAGLLRASVKPGLTGLWQVSGRSSLPFDRLVALDLEYVEKAGFWFDLLILAKTIPTVLSMKGAF